MNNRSRYERDRNDYRSRERHSYMSQRTAPRRFGAREYLLPAIILALGVTVLTLTVLGAAAGAFDRKENSDGLYGTAHDLLFFNLRTPDPSEDPQQLVDWRVDSLLSDMTVEQKVGQLLLIRSHGADGQEFCEEIASVNAGGVVLFAGDIRDKSADELTAYISDLQEAGGGSLFVCVDEEGGTVVRVSSNRQLRDRSFRSPQKLYAEGGMNLIAYDAVDKAFFLKEFGINVNFAPVADVVTDPNAMMYDRAFGQDAAATAEYVTNVVAFSDGSGVGTCLKHFPGYGNAVGDTHNGLVTLDTTLEQLRSCDLLPFSAGIDAGCGAVMITHTVMSSIDPDRPASMSPAVISLLRDELGFTGVTVSDGMDMGAIEAYSGGNDVCVAAFLAGIDLICTPADSREAYDALLAAVNDGTVPVGQLDQSVRRILHWKLSLGLY